ncbi:hypothetical protein CXG81DRAFT_16211, partial [Caulochytrium protostelioides]
MASTTPYNKSKLWILDSGASQHMTPHRSAFVSLTALAHPRPITTGNGSVIYARSSGTVHVKPPN